jgi:hemoglobin
MSSEKGNNETGSENPAGPTPYEIMGNDQGIKRLVDRFYELMDSVPEYHGIRKLHPADLASSNDKLYRFLSGWLGGPPLYMEKYGHPMLRARHLPYPIGASERDAWLACMLQAIEDCDIEPALREPLMKAFYGTADWMRNKPEPGAPTL